MASRALESWVRSAFYLICNSFTTYKGNPLILGHNHCSNPVKDMWMCYDVVTRMPRRLKSQATRLFNSMFILTAQQTSELSLHFWPCIREIHSMLALCEGNPLVPGGFFTRASNAESVSVACRHHGPALKNGAIDAAMDHSKLKGGNMPFYLYIIL